MRLLPASQQQYQTPDYNNSYFRSIDLSVSKRITGKWSITSSYLGDPGRCADQSGGAPPPLRVVCWFPRSRTCCSTNLARTLNASFKVFGTYRVPFGIAISPIYRFQLLNANRKVSHRQWIACGNLRHSRICWQLPPGQHFHLRYPDRKAADLPRPLQGGLFFDAFNINNSNAAQIQDAIMASKTITVKWSEVDLPTLSAPTTVISPRIFRLGAKFSF